LAKELYPGGFDPTPTHFFIKLLADKNLLIRNYSQNIDGLEYIAGLSTNLLVQAHGGFQTAHCISCNKEYPESEVKKAVFSDQIPTCSCNGMIKPDIVFFGESLPQRYHELSLIDFEQCDCLIVMGTSLKVQPFASLIDRVPNSCVRLLINNEAVGEKKKCVGGLG